MQRSCPNPSLKNGVSRIRQNGRRAMFTCDVGFSMHGQRYAICANGKWDTELPLCISKLNLSSVSFK